MSNNTSQQDQDQQKQQHRYISVKQNRDFGYWDIDLEKQTADLRKETIRNRVLRKHDVKSSSTALPIIEQTEYYNIIDFLLSELDIQYAKEVIIDRRYIFSKDLMCSVRDCFNKAYVVSNGNKRCKKHSFDIQTN